MAVINESALKKAITNVKKAKEKFRADVQEVLVAVAYQAAMGNPNWANELIWCPVKDCEYWKPKRR